MSDKPAILSSMNVKKLIDTLQQLISDGEITEDFALEYHNGTFRGRSRVDYIRIEKNNNVVLLCEEWY